MLWKFKIETMLKVRDFRGFIDKKETKPKVTTSATLATYEKKESFALNLIGQSLLNGQLFIMQRSPL
jgi:hypothetical protein